MLEKVFSLKKIISLKHSGVRSCFEDFIETNTPVQSYGGQDRKYIEVPKLKYLVVQKCGTNYQKVGPNTNLI